MPTGLAQIPGDPVLRRVALLTHVAASRGDGLSLEEAVELLPEGAPATPQEFRRWAAEHEDDVRILGDVISSPGLTGVLSERLVRGRRSGDQMEEARYLLEGPLAPVRSLALVVAVTGSVAYRSPRPQDDLDLLVIVKRGSLGLFLFWSYLALRREGRKRRNSRALPPVCMNLVLDKPHAESLFATPSGLLVAREALTAVVIQGAEEYRGLLSKAAWMRGLLPRLYQRVVDKAEEARDRPKDVSAPVLVRATSALLFLPLAAYLQFVGLWRNHSLRSEVGKERVFRTLVAPGRVQFTSIAFDRLRDAYELRPTEIS